MHDDGIFHNDLPAHATAPLVCRRCGSMTTPLVTPGTGQHAFRANCPDCGVFIKWIIQYQPEERARRQAAARLEAMARLDPTVGQLDYLRDLGDTQPAPANRAEASRRIETLLRSKGA